MSYKGLLSNIIITILVVCSIVMLFMLYSISSPFAPFDITSEPIDAPEEAGMIMLIPMLIVGMALLLLLVWPLAIALMHAVCLIFTVKNRRAERRDLRIWSYVLDGMNTGLVLAALFLIVLWRMRA